MKTKRNRLTLSERVVIQTLLVEKKSNYRLNTAPTWL